MAVWNQPDSELRRKAIRALWTEDGAHILQPPEQIRKAAAGLGFSSTVLEARGHDALEVRVTRAYGEFVAPGGFTFRPRDNADRLPRVVARLRRRRRLAASIPSKTARRHGRTLRWI